MKQEVPQKNTVFFLCSPSLGILDNWLSVLWRLKEKRDDLKFIIIFPKASSVDQIQLSNILIVLAAKIFDSVVFKSQAGHWMVAESFSQVKRRSKLTWIEWFLLGTIKKLKKWPITKLAGRIIQYLYATYIKSINRRYLYDWQIVGKHGVCMLYDLYEDSKAYNLELMEAFKELPKFSIQHGININDGGVTEKKENFSEDASRKDIKAYLFSAKEIPSYEHNYGIHSSFMEVVGVPRHNPDWMEFIRLSMLEQSNEINSLNRGAIFIISRPGNTVYHSYERKKKALEAIKQLAWNDLEKNIVIKLHPKETNEGIYEEVFGTDTYGKKWVYSELHPFVLGKECSFAISFWSGVVIDMLALGIPVIEYLDLRGIQGYDNEESLRDKMGHPVFSYRYLDLVLGASDYKQLKAYAMEIMNNRETVMSKLQAKYNELFPLIEDVNENIANDILSSVYKNN